MANAVKWSAYGTFATAIVGTSSGLRNMANAARVLGDEIDNTSGRNQYADFILDIKAASSFSSGGFFALYFIPCVDGTNYADGSSSVVPGAQNFVRAFQVQANTNQQKLSLIHVPLPAGKFKCLLENKAGQATTNANDTDNLLSIRPYNDEVQ